MHGADDMTTLDFFALPGVVELDLQKAQGINLREPHTGDRGPIRGVIGSDAWDHDGESVRQDGADWDYFLREGWFNYEHQPGPENILGEPSRLFEVTDSEGFPATGVEGFLYLDRPKAREVYETAVTLQKAHSARRLGFSVEGQTLERDPSNPKIVTRCRVLNVTITRHPVNGNARFEALLKGLLKSIGYHLPQAADPSAHLSPLAVRSIDRSNTPSLEPQSLKAARRTITVGQLAELLCKRNPSLSKSRALRLAKDLVVACRAGL